MVTQNRYAPGARVEIRDCEWIVRRADPTDDGGYLLTVDGLSELVSGKTAEFLTDLEGDGLRLLDPAETELELDDSPGFEKSRLFIETQLRQITPSDERIHLGDGYEIQTAQGRISCQWTWAGAEGRNPWILNAKY